MWGDPLYWAIIAIGGLISLFASLMVQVAFNRGRRVKIQSGMSGAEAAQQILNSEGITDVSIRRHRGFLSDHYNPMNKTLNLSPEVYDGRNASAVGVAAHEVGHAIQHAHHYGPLWFRSFLVPIANIGSNLGLWLIILGMSLQAFTGAGSMLNWTSVGGVCAWIGIIGFGSAVLFSLVTVPVEFNASSRAKKILAREGILQTNQEKQTVFNVLLAAGMTYVAAAIQSVLNLVYWLIRLGVLRNDD